MRESPPRQPIKPAIDQVRREDLARGARKKPYHSEYAARRKRLRAWISDVIERGNEQEFKTGISEYGLPPGSSEYESLLRLYRDAVRRRRMS